MSAVLGFVSANVPARTSFEAALSPGFKDGQVPRPKLRWWIRLPEAV